MKLINILEAIANNNLKDKTRLKVCSSSNREAFILEFDISYPGTLWCIDENDETYKFNYHIDFMRILNYEVTIIEGGFIEEGSDIKISGKEFLKGIEAFNEAFPPFKKSKKIKKLPAYDYREIINETDMDMKIKKEILKIEERLYDYHEKIDEIIKKINKD